MFAYLKDHPEVIASVLAFAGALLRLLDNRLKARAILAAPSEDARDKIANLPPVSGLMVLLLAAAALVSCLLALVKFEQQMASAAECHTDKAFILQPNNWPMWPFLTLKRYNAQNELQVGFLVDAASERNTVFLGNLFTTKGQTDGLEKIRYICLDALLSDGWKVD
jgi:hypothetical protein